MIAVSEDELVELIDAAKRAGKQTSDLEELLEELRQGLLDISDTPFELRFTELADGTTEVSTGPSDGDDFAGVEFVRVR